MSQFNQFNFLFVFFFSSIKLKNKNLFNSTTSIGIFSKSGWAILLLTTYQEKFSRRFFTSTKEKAFAWGKRFSSKNVKLENWTVCREVLCKIKIVRMIWKITNLLIARQLNKLQFLVSITIKVNSSEILEVSFRKRQTLFQRQTTSFSLASHPLKTREEIPRNYYLFL